MIPVGISLHPATNEPRRQRIFAEPAVAAMDVNEEGLGNARMGEPRRGRQLHPANANDAHAAVSRPSRALHPVVGREDASEDSDHAWIRTDSLLWSHSAAI